MTEFLNNSLESEKKAKEKEKSEQIEQSKKEIKEVKNAVVVNADVGVAVPIKETADGNPWPWKEGESYSAIRLTAKGQVFKETIGETDVYALFYQDGNPLKATPYGKLALTKKVVDLGKAGKFNLEGEYSFPGKNWNVMRYGISYAGILPNGWYKIKLLPLNQTGEATGTSFDVRLSGNVKIGKNGTFSGLMNVTGLEKAAPSFYSELNYNHQIANGISLFGELRTWWTFKDPYVAPMVGVRATIK